MGSELGSLGYAHFGLKVANEDLVSGISLPKMISHQQNPEISISPMSAAFRFYPPKRYLDEEMQTPVSITHYMNNTPRRTRQRLRLSRPGSSMVSPLLTKQPRIMTAGGDFKDAITMNAYQPSPLIHQPNMLVSNRNGHIPFSSHPPLHHQSSYNMSLTKNTQLLRGLPPGHVAYNTPINTRTFFNIDGPSPSNDRIHLQISAYPQMSEIPKEERVQYAYQQQIKLQKKINH